MTNHLDVLIVGAGPAGLSAALTARACGLDVALVDEQGHKGGQIFRNLHLSSGQNALCAHDRELGLQLFADFEKCGAQFFPSTTVWGLKGHDVYCQHAGEAKCISASKILFATGGMERPAPFKGWTLPGVMTAGAAEILLRSGVFLESKTPIVLAGNGPLLLSLAVHLIDAKIPIAAWLDSGRLRHKLTAMIHMGAVYKDIPYFMRGLKMALKILKHKIPLIPEVTHMEALGEKYVESVSYEKNGKQNTIATHTLIRHENVIPRIQIASALDLELAWDAVQRYWYPKTDAFGRTSQNHIFMAGDTAFVHGGEAALAKGALAGIAMAQDLGVISPQEAESKALPYFATAKKLSKARKYLHHVFAPNPQIYRVPDETIICRCESVRAEDIRHAIHEGYTTPDEVKRFTRAGMGPCQGRMCSNSLAEIIAEELKIDVKHIPIYKNRQPFAPVSLGDYCALCAKP